MTRVLAVDDDPAGLELRRLILERRGYQVATASDADQARFAFQETTPEIVILDLRLPEAEDGLSLIREFRAASAAVRMVVLSGDTSALEGREEAAMVDVILAKPVRTERLLEALTAPSGRGSVR